VAQGYEECRLVTQEYSKTFFLGSQLLGSEEQRAVWAIYNWCRATDELVDGPAAETTTMADLEAWEKKTSSLFEATKTEDLLDLALIDSIRKFKLIQRPFDDMIGGMAMDLVKERYETFQELEVYCYRVAGTVGIMTLPILGFDLGSGGAVSDEEEKQQIDTIDSALALGLAFQLTNILRDIGEDAQRGRIYMPLEDLRAYGIEEEEVFAASRGESKLWLDQRWRNFMQFQIARCRGYYEKAAVGIIGLSDDSRLGVMTALNVYGEILDAIYRNEYNNFTQRAFVSLPEKVGLIAKSWLSVQELKLKNNDNIQALKSEWAEKLGGFQPTN